jgi:hypothetical protein
MIFLSVLTVFFVGASIREIRFTLFGTATSARVEATEGKKSQRGISVVYEVNGATVRTRLARHAFGEKYHTGDQISILYHPADPGRIVIDSADRYLFLAISAAVLTVLWFGCFQVFPRAPWPFRRNFWWDWH